MVVQCILSMRMGQREVESDTEDEKNKIEGINRFCSSPYFMRVN